MSRFSRRLPVLAILGVAVLGACTDQDAVTIPAAETPGGELFARYVALGNSITAGFQSGGINDSTQMRSYPVFLAQQAGHGQNFGVPILRGACPLPLAAPFRQERVPVRLAPSNPALACDRAFPGPRFVQNLAVPGAVIASALNLQPAANPLTTYVLGGRTPVEAMLAAQPSFVSVWLGNNDALGAAVGGSPALLTAADAFQASLTGLAAGIGESTAQGAVLIGVVNPTVVPALQPGAFFWLAYQNPATRPLLPRVDDNCAPGTPGGSNLISVAMVQDTAYQRAGINCSNSYVPNAQVPPQGTYFPGRYVLTADEAQQVVQRVAQFNQAIAAAAEQNGWLFFDPNPLLMQNLNDPNAIRKCQALPAALQTGNPQTIAQAVATTCPSPDPAQGFGNLFSFDGVHPSTRAHRIITNALIDAINQQYQRSIPSLTVN